MSALDNFAHARTLVRSFDDLSAFQLGPALLFAVRTPLDMFPPPPSPQSSLSRLFPEHTVMVRVASPPLGLDDDDMDVGTHTSEQAQELCYRPISTMDEGRPLSELQVDDDEWRLHTAFRISRRTARSVRLSKLSSSIRRLELSPGHSRVASIDAATALAAKSLYAPIPLARQSSVAAVERGLVSSHSPSVAALERGLAPPCSPDEENPSDLRAMLAPSLDTSPRSTLDGHTLREAILTPTQPTFETLHMMDAHDALTALEHLASDPDSDLDSPKRSSDLEPMEALIWAAGSEPEPEFHPFRASQVSAPTTTVVTSQLYEASRWRELPPLPHERVMVEKGRQHSSSVDEPRQRGYWCKIAPSHRRAESTPHSHAVNRRISEPSHVHVSVTGNGKNMKTFHHHHYHHHHIHHHTKANV